MKQIYEKIQDIAGYLTPPLMAKGAQIQSVMREQEKAADFQAKIPGSLKLLPQAWIY